MPDPAPWRGTQAAPPRRGRKARRLAGFSVSAAAAGSPRPGKDDRPGIGWAAPAVI